MPAFVRCLDIFDRQRCEALPVCAPDNLNRARGVAFDQARSDRNVQQEPGFGLIGDRAGDACAVCFDVQDQPRGLESRGCADALSFNSAGQLVCAQTNPVWPLALYFKLQTLSYAYCGWLAAFLVAYCVLTMLTERYCIRRFGWQ